MNQYLAKMRRAKALAAKCTSWNPPTHSLLKEAKITPGTDGASVNVAFEPRAGEPAEEGQTFSFTHHWIDGGSVEQIAGSLISIASKLNA